MTAPAGPAPDVPPEDFPPEIAGLLDRADAICTRRGARLTSLRRLVLGLILQGDGPTGAYDLLDRLKARRPAAAPPTVYRALEFLLAQGLIHRVERLSAFVGCVAHSDHDHAAQFLICRGCGRVTELEDAGVERALQAAARRAGFHIQGATIEAEGRCAGCGQSA